MKQSRRDKDNFQNQLQGKLSELSNRRSQKKIKIKPILQIYQEQNNKYYEDCQKILMFRDKEKAGGVYEAEGKDSNSSSTYKNAENIGKSRGQWEYQKSMRYGNNNNTNIKFRINSQHNQQQQQQKHHINSQPQFKNKLNLSNINQNCPNMDNIFTTVQNKQLQKFLLDNIPPSNLDLGFFLAKCLAKYGNQHQISEPHIKTIFLQLQQELTTTDPNTISLNALQLAVKKKYNSLQLYINEKIMQSKITIQNEKLCQKQNKLQRLHKQYQVNATKLEQRKKKVGQLQQMMAQREKSLCKKQKQYTNKQKQLLQRVKNHKKGLQQRAQKLSQQHLTKLNLITQKIQKKIGTYERNMKYRIQTINSKINQLHRIREYKQGDIKSTVIKQQQQKYEKLMQAKIKKYESQYKQLNSKYEAVKKQVKQQQQQNNKLMKVCTKLESKLKLHQSDANKIKQLKEIIQHKDIEIKESKFLCAEKEKQNEEIISKYVQRERSHNNSIQQVNAMSDRKYSQKTKTKQKQQPMEQQQKQLKISTTKSKKSLQSLHPSKHKSQSKPKTKINSKQAQQTQNILQYDNRKIIQEYENLLHFLLHPNNSNTNSNNNFNSNTIVCKLIIQNYIVIDKHMLMGMIDAGVRMLTNGVDCVGLLAIMGNYVVYSVCNKITQNNNNKGNKNNKSRKQFCKYISAQLQQLSQAYNQQHKTLIHNYINKNKTNKNNNYYICLYNVQLIHCLLSATYEQYQYWLKQINQIKQHTQIYQYIMRQINNTIQEQQQQKKYRYYNSLYAIMIKYYIYSNTYKQHNNINININMNMNILSICTDIILKFKLITQHKHIYIWDSNNNIISMGNCFLQTYIVHIRQCLQNQQIFNTSYQQIQKISILMQRLAHHHHIHINAQHIQYLNAIKSKCNNNNHNHQDSLLQMNINSIVQSYSMQNQNILRELHYGNEEEAEDREDREDYDE